jgi:hypothetical protein
VTPPAEAKRPRGHPAEPDYPGAGHPIEKRRRASRSGARAATRYPQGPEGVAGRAGPTHAGAESQGHPLRGRYDLMVTVAAGVRKALLQ